MKIIIGTQDISDIVALAQPSQSCLAESEAITLSGRRQRDRFGTFKTDLNLIIGRVSYARWLEVSELLKELPVSVTVVNDDKEKRYNMCLDGELPSPYIYTDISGDYCAGIAITLKEVG